MFFLLSYKSVHCLFFNATSSQQYKCAMPARSVWVSPRRPTLSMNRFADFFICFLHVNFLSIIFLQSAMSWVSSLSYQSVSYQSVSYNRRWDEWAAFLINQLLTIGRCVLVAVGVYLQPVGVCLQLVGVCLQLVGVCLQLVGANSLSYQLFSYQSVSYNQRYDEWAAFLINRFLHPAMRRVSSLSYQSVSYNR